MSESFDPYLQWLGIRDPERPPSHYRLLGLDLFESDPEVISGAADRQMSHVRTFQTGPNAAVSQALLNELAVARRCLLNEQSRADYDHRLRTGSLNITTKRPPASVARARIIDGASASYRTKKSKRFWFDLAGWVGGGLAAVIVAYFLINSSWFKAELADSPSGGDTRLPQPKDPDTVEPDPVPPQPDLSNPPIAANLPDDPAERPPEKGGDDDDPVKHKAKQSIAEKLMDGVWRIEWSNKIVYTDVRFHPDGRFTGISSHGKTAMKDTWQQDGDQVAMGQTIFREVDGQIVADDPRYQGVLTKRAVADGSSPPVVGNNNKSDPADSETPMEPAVGGDAVAIAPWDETDRLPELPDFIAKPNNNADRRFQPIYVGLANRKYDLVKQFYPKVEKFADQLSQPVDVGSVVAQLEEFWQLARRNAVDVQLGDTLSFRNRNVTVSGVSDRSIELEWLPTSDDGRPAVERFSTKQEDMDRDLAIALATRDSSNSNALVDNFRQYDYLHAKIPVPPELVVGTGVQLSEMAGLLGSDPSAKVPVPDKESLHKARQTILDLYADGFAAAGFLKKQELAGKLLADADSTGDEALRYVLLEEASQLGADNGDGNVVFTALSEINNDYEIEFWSELVDQLGAAQKNAKSGVALGTITSSLFEAINLAARQEQYEIAVRLSNDGFKAAKKLGAENQVALFDDYRRQLVEMVEWNELGPKSLKKLESDPDSAKDHLAVARCLCFVKGDWEAGVEHLAKSGSSKLARLAQKDLQLNVEQKEDVLSLADDWYDIGQNNKGTARRALLSRAHHWYAVAKDLSSGLNREKARQRIIELQPLLEFFDPYVDDEVFVQATTWRFGTKDKVVFPTASFRDSVFEYESPGNNRRSRRLNLTKFGDTYQVETADPKSRTNMRLMRNGQIELLVYSLEDGRVMVAGWGEPIDP